MPKEAEIQTGKQASRRAALIIAAADFGRAVAAILTSFLKRR